MCEVVVRGSDGQDLTFAVPSPEFTVLDLKQKIQERRSIAIRDQRLLYGGQMLQDGRTLESYNINDGFVIRLLISVPTPAASLNPIVRPATTVPILANVFVSGAAVGSGTMNFTNIPADCKVQRFKEMMYDRTGDNPENIRLIYGGKEFENSRGGTEMTLMDYGVTNNTTLHFVLSLPGGADAEPKITFTP